MSNVTTFDIQCAGYAVKADFYEGESTSEILIAFIGWTSSKAKYRKSGLIPGVIKKTGQSALVLDYSGHGDSPFDVATTRPAQHFLEVIYVFDWLVEKYPESEITVFGTSYGGFMATQLTKYRTFKNLVLRVPALYRPQDFYSLSPKWARTESTRTFRKDAEAISRHPLLARASSYDGNTLVVVHDRDELVPAQTTDAYIKAFNADVLTFDALHAPDGKSAEWFENYQQQMANWIRTHT